MGGNDGFSLEDVPPVVDFRRRSGDRQAAFTVSLLPERLTFSAATCRSRAAHSARGWTAFDVGQLDAVCYHFATAADYAHHAGDCRLNPLSRSSLATVGAETACPWRVSSLASCRSDLVGLGRVRARRCLGGRLSC